jgi:hypothetical protein
VAASTAVLMTVAALVALSAFAWIAISSAVTSMSFGLPFFNSRSAAFASTDVIVIFRHLPAHPCILR